MSLPYNKEIDEYKYKSMPWVSKSKLTSWTFCPFNFYLNTVENAKPTPIDEQLGRSGPIGGNMHLIFNEFWKYIKNNKMIDDFMRINVELWSPKDSQLYWAFFAVCQDILPKEARGVPDYARILSNFAELQVQNWIWISQNVGMRKSDYEKYWIPRYTELFLEDPQGMWYGTIDAVYNNPNFENDGMRYIIMDYKTGNTPKSVWSFQGENRMSISLPTAKMAELHFYASLMASASVNAIGNKWELYRGGGAADVTLYLPKGNPPEPVEGCNWVMTAENQQYWRPVFPEIKSYKDVMIAVAYLGRDEPYVVPKKPNKKSMDTVNDKIDLLRDEWNSNGMDGDKWLKDANSFKCEMCFHAGRCSEIQAVEMLES
jgi:hypothetical protein